jgi:hypothetical protein
MPGIIGEALAMAGAIGIIAVVYIHILSLENILNWWFRWGNRFERRWFFRPLWGCEKCFAGQVALWLYVIIHFPASETWQIADFWPWAVEIILSGIIWLFGAVLQVCGAILSAYTINKFITKK